MKYEIRYTNLHLLEVQDRVRLDNRNRAGIYMLLNRVNNKKYIGSAATDRIYLRFRNHLFHRTGSKLTAIAVAKYGVENFDFFILEYFPGFVKKENLSSAHTKLLLLESKFIEDFQPEYNLLQKGVSFNGFLLTEDTHLKMRDGYSLSRKNTIANLNRGKTFSEERRILLSKIATLRNANQELRAELSKNPSKPIILYNKDGCVHSKFPGIGAMAAQFACCNKTINKAIQNQSIFRQIGVIKLDQS